MWKSGSSFAEVVAKNNNPSSHKFMRKSNETAHMYIARLKKEIYENNATGPFNIFTVSRNEETYKVSARNEYVAKYFATKHVKANFTKLETNKTQMYVNFAVSDPDEGYKIGIHDDMDLEEATHIARDFYRSMQRKRIDTSTEWIHAFVIQTSESYCTEGSVFE